MQHRLKAPPGPAWARIVPAELFRQLLAVDPPVAALDPRLATGTPGAACSSAQKLTWSSCLPMVGPPRARSSVWLLPQRRVDLRRQAPTLEESLRRSPAGIRRSGAAPRGCDRTSPGDGRL